MGAYATYLDPDGLDSHGWAADFPLVERLALCVVALRREDLVKAESMNILLIAPELYGVELLQAFARVCTKKVLTPDDWRRFYEFSLFVHQHNLVISPRMVREYLATEGCSLQKASSFSKQFEHLRAVLKMYDDKLLSPSSPTANKSPL